MTTAEKIDDRAIRTFQGRRVIESFIVKGVLAGVPHHARVDFLSHVPEIRGLKPEDVIARACKEQHLAGMEQRSVNRQHLREIREQSPYAFCGGRIDVEFEIR